MANAQIQNHMRSLNCQNRRYCDPAISLGEKGAVTLFVLLMTMTLTMLFAALVSFGTKQTRHAEMLRTLELTGQSILHTYDRRLLEAYSLLAVDLEFVEPSAYLSGPSGPNLSWKRPGRRWTFEPRRSLDQPAYFIEAVRQAVAAGVADEVLNGFAGWLSEVPVLGKSREGLMEENTSGSIFEAHLSGTEEERSNADDSDESEVTKESEELAEATQAERELAAKGIRWIRKIGKTEEAGGIQDPQNQDQDQTQDQTQDKTMESELQAKLVSRDYLGPRAALSPSDRVPFLFYVAHHFRHWVADSRAAFYITTPQPSFFKAELEYILYGYDDEAFSKARAFSEIYLMRLAGNVAHVSACSEKQEVIGAVAGAVNAVTGVPALITSSALALTWGMAESRSDLLRLLNGEVLPWVHVTDEAWRTRFGDGGDEAAAATRDALKQDDPTLADYGDHLIALLAAKATTSHVLRVMDLILIGDGENGIDLSRRATRFAIHVEPDGGLPGVIWEDGYGLD